MERLRVGDTFCSQNNKKNPYTVINVMSDGYVVRQQSKSIDETYNTSAIHELFTLTLPWELIRKEVIHFEDDLFTL